MERKISIIMPAYNASAFLCRSISMDEIGYIGDDLNDLQCMEAVGFRACPADAASQIQNICHYVSVLPGGHGAVRESLEYLLTRRGLWDATAKETYCV